MKRKKKTCTGQIQACITMMMRPEIFTSTFFKWSMLHLCCCCVFHPFPIRHEQRYILKPFLVLLHVQWSKHFEDRHRSRWGRGKGVGVVSHRGMEALFCLRWNSCTFSSNHGCFFLFFFSFIPVREFVVVVGKLSPPVPVVAVFQRKNTKEFGPLHEMFL